MGWRKVRNVLPSADAGELNVRAAGILSQFRGIMAFGIYGFPSLDWERRYSDQSNTYYGH